MSSSTARPDTNVSAPVPGSKLLVPVLLGLAMISLSGCSWFKPKDEDPDAPPKTKPYKYRDPVEQRVFYDGWFER